MPEEFEQEIDNFPEEELPEQEIAEIVEEIVEEPKSMATPDDIRRQRQDAKDRLSSEDRKYWEMGWRPKELFAGKNRDGSPKEWVPLEKFKELINNNPSVRAEREKALERKLEQMHHSVEKITKFNQLKLDREHQVADARIKQELDDAEAIGDLASYKDALRKKEMLQAEKAAIQQVEAPQQDPIITYEVNSFKDRNSWYGTDKEMSEYSIEQFNIINKNPRFAGLSIRDKLQKVEDSVRALFSDKFPSKTQKNIPMVESSKSSGAMTYQRQNAPTKVEYHKLPDDEQRRIDQLSKMKRMTRDEVMTKFYIKK